jgi:hypothetical protein
VIQVNSYEVWDTVSQSLVEDFGDEAEAVAALREMGDVTVLALACRDERGHTEWVVGGELRRLAERYAVT